MGTEDVPSNWKENILETHKGKRKNKNQNQNQIKTKQNKRNWGKTK